ncbi:hypothetical protein MNBD_GAMMA25-2027 [hydrothermal vent metagenome]|uniref:Hemerythrin family protein n=1 Tax=hydrothermal vent metagenome TaxID=652676 RepID=A0A3B1ATB2_9ZZZZ
MSQRGTGQKIVFVIAIFCYLLAAACGVTAFYLSLDAGFNEPVVAAFAASVVFFVGSGVVLHMMARTNLPDLKIK